MFTLPTQLEFLSSVSFWCGVVVAIATYMTSQGIIPQDITTLITIILGSVVGVRLKNQIAGAIVGQTSNG